MRELTDINYLESLFSKHGFNLKKGLGQNFLIDPTVCPAIAECAGIDNEGVIEIGPGAGVLTRELSKRAKKVVAIELDTKLAPLLSETLNGFENVFVKFDDAMKCDLETLIKEEFGDMPVSVCANLPYYITSPLIMRLLEEDLPVKAVTVMVQKEAADRICAQMGTRECGAVTAAVRYYSEPEIMFQVKRTSFLPPPKVDSSVIKLNIKADTELVGCDKDNFFKTVKAAFYTRRKTVVNSVSTALNLDKAYVTNALIKCGLEPDIRAEKIKFEEFALLANALFEVN